MNLLSKILFIFTALCCLNVAPQKAHAQAAQEEYGKNRIQYKTFSWQYLSSVNFEIYYYDNNESLARTTAQYAEAEFNRVTELIGFSPYSKIRLYVYANKAELQQSNVGLELENSIVGGRTNFVKSIVEVPFEGNQILFRREISRGIAQTLINDMMYGGSFKDVVQNNYLLLLPDWFIGGAVRYVSDGWSVDMDDRVRNAMRQNRWKKPSNLLGEEAEIAGQSIWNYIAEKYGRSNLSNILNLTRILRNEENSIGSTLAIPYDKAIRDWRNYYTAMADRASVAYKLPEKQQRIKQGNRQHWVYTDVATSDNGQLIAYAENKDGRCKVSIYNTQTGKKKTVWRGGHRLISQKTDRQQPLVAWQANEVLHILAVKNSKIKATAYNVNTRKSSTNTLSQFRQISGFDVSADGQTMVLSADNIGQSDIFLLNIAKGNITSVTKDLYDDQDPQFWGNNIVFSSNRLNDTLAVSKKATPKDIFNNYNLFVFSSGAKVLKRLNNTVFNETRPRVLDSQQLVYLCDESGILNLKKYDSRTNQSVSLSEWEYNVKNYDLAPSQNGVAMVMRNDGAEYLYWQPKTDFNKAVVNLNTRRQELISDRLFRINQKTLIADSSSVLVPKTVANNTPALDSAVTPAKVKPDTIIMLNTNEIDIRNYVFESEKFKKPAIKIPSKISVSKPSPLREQQSAPPSITGPFVYLNRLSTNNITTTATLDPLRGLGFLVDVSMTDMFENHKIKAGLLPFSDLRSSNIFAEYQYLRYLIDFKLRFEKQSYFFSSEQNSRRYNLNKFEATAAYPFSLAHRIELTPFVAQTRYVNLDNATTSLNQPDVKQLYSGIKAEYVYDQTISHGMNMLEGTRGKVSVEQYMGIGNSSKSFGNIRLDLRHYQPIHKEIVLALRGSFGSFFGKSPKNYLLGGMDNWIGGSGRFFDNQSPNNPLATQVQGEQNIDWMFMQFATNLRGFKYNTMFGSHYMLFNAELRIPIIRYLYRGPISSNFLRNFQIVAFTDAGTAWQKGSPFDRKNNYNTKTTNANPFTITVQEYYNPILSGYGLGLRTMVLGYYLKTDLAWGLKDYELQSPRFYFSLGYDF